MSGSAVLDDWRGDLDTVDRLAQALRMRRYQVMLAIGSLAEAGALAARVEAGELSLDRAKALIEEAQRGRTD